MNRQYKYAKVFQMLNSFKGYKFNGFEIKNGVIFIFLKKTRKTSDCPKCNRKCRIIEENFKRTIRDLDMKKFKCYITFFENKIRCKCGYRGIESLDFVRPCSRCTINFEDYISFLCQKMSIKDVAEILDLNWKSVKNIDKLQIRNTLPDIEDFNPKGIGVDEIAYKKGHNYLTVVRDLDLGKVIWVGIKRKKETLDEFFKLIGIEKCLQITKVVLEMWDPFIASVKENCLNAELIFDKFHIEKKVNEAIDDIRKKEFKNAKDSERKDMKKKAIFDSKQK